MPNGDCPDENYMRKFACALIVAREHAPFSYAGFRRWKSWFFNAESAEARIRGTRKGLGEKETFGTFKPLASRQLHGGLVPAPDLGRTPVGSCVQRDRNGKSPDADAREVRIGRFRILFSRTGNGVLAVVNFMRKFSCVRARVWYGRVELDGA